VRIAVPAGRDGRHIPVKRREIPRPPVGQIHREQMLPFPRAPIVPVPVKLFGPQARISGVFAVAAVDLLLGWPFDVAGHE
jgi:hypothetical protein